MIKSYQVKGKKFYFIQLSFTDESGKRCQPKFRKDPEGKRITSKSQAQKLELHYLNQAREKMSNANTVLFTDWHQTFLEEITLSLKYSTVLHYDGDLKKWLPKEFCETPLNEITKRDVHTLIHSTLCEKGATPNTRAKVLKCLKRIFNSAIAHGELLKDPSVGLKVQVPPVKRLVLNAQEAQALLHEAKRIEHPFYYHWALALYSGLRNGELYALRWVDVSLNNQMIKVHSSWSNKDGYKSTKNNKSRSVPITKNLIKVLEDLKRAGPFSETLTGLNGKKDHFDDLVLPRSSEWKHGEQSRHTKSFCNTNNLPEIKFHDLRATFITNLLSEGVSLAKVMAIVGHARVSTTNEYLRLAGLDIKGVTDSLAY